jgi:SAM-dependent methyltransferase
MPDVPPSVDQTEAYRDQIERSVQQQIKRFRAAARGVTPRNCPICGYFGMFSVFGNPPRFDARCGKCNALERHRLFYLYCTRTGYLQPQHTLLHFAPEAPLVRFVKSAVGTYETADISPDRNVTHRINIEVTGLPDAAYDRILCSHVLEHVDDAKALSELHRMLRPGGSAMILTPIVEGWATTYENPSVDGAQQRTLHFGQSDHVRMYGRDLRDRIRAAGFALAEYTAVEPDVLTYGLMRGETLFIATRQG